ncbi:MAG: adenine deaminase [Chloroflexi bacterium]|nr:MAG: adenine deaminase [Chloroflexota bacterium]
MSEMRPKWLAVARGDEPADLVLTGGQVFSVFTREWLPLDVAIVDDHVVGLGNSYRGERRVELQGAYLVPGFIDAHMHIESSKLMVDEFARAVLPHGTTTVVADPHELANVLGTDGVHWLLDTCAGIPLDVFVMASSCVPASQFESPRRPMTIGDIKSLLRRSRTLGVAEMMNFPGVIAAMPEEVDKLQTGLTEHVDGHAPGVRGAALNAYIAAGIRSDHEATTYEEALEKRRLGMAVMLREASIARNLRDLLPLVKKYGPEHCMFCTDDREPNFIVEEGHINQMVRVAVEDGIPPESALVMASHNAAEYHGLRHLGAISPGYQADILVLDDLRTFRPSTVFKAGREIGDFPKLQVPEWVRQTVHVAPVTAASFRVNGGGGLIRVIRVIPRQLLTGVEEMEPNVRDGEIAADPSRDLFASTVAHDAHNIVVLGVDDTDMALCVSRLAEIGGGIVVVEEGSVRGELPLPVAGLMSDRPLDFVHERLAALEGMLAGMGVTLGAPFMTISFLALSVIPDLKITDRGLVDVKRFQLVRLEV